MSFKDVLGFDPTIVGEGGSGWIPPEARDIEMQAVHEAVMAGMPSFGEVNSYDDLPDECIFATLEIKATGKVLPRIWQKSGSCVGAGAAMAYVQSMCGDIVARGDNEEAKHCYPWATYGMGRKLGGMNRTGEGSFGSAQARAVKEWGMLPGDDTRLPQPMNRDGWLVWSSSIEIQWSHPNGWPIPESTLRDDASRFQILETAQVRQVNDVKRALSQGYGVTLASMFGTRNERVIDGYLVGDWTASWSHQMSCGGYSTHPTLGIVYWIQNQWGPSAHPSCPKMSALGVNGGFWIKESTMQQIINKGEVFIHSNTEGFPARQIKWRDWTV